MSKFIISDADGLESAKSFSNKMASRSNFQLGFSLIEILLSLIVLAIGLLSIAKAEITAFRFNRSAYFTSIANVQASAVLECLRVVKSVSVCEQHVNTMLMQLLPSGQCVINLNKQEYQLLIAWHQPQRRYKKALCNNYFPGSYNCIAFTGKL